MENSKEAYLKKLKTIPIPNIDPDNIFDKTIEKCETFIHILFDLIQPNFDTPFFKWNENTRQVEMIWYLGTAKCKIEVCYYGQYTFIITIDGLTYCGGWWIFDEKLKIDDISIDSSLIRVLKLL